jgi:hypothetical protein
MPVNRVKGKFARPPFFTGALSSPSVVSISKIKKANQLLVRPFPTNPKMAKFVKQVLAKKSTKNGVVRAQSFPSQIDRRRVFIENAKKGTKLPPGLKKVK